MLMSKERESEQALPERWSAKANGIPGQSTLGFMTGTLRVVPSGPAYGRRAPLQDTRW